MTNINPWLVLVHAHDYVWYHHHGMSARDLWMTLDLLHRKSIEVHEDTWKIAWLAIQAALPKKSVDKTPNTAVAS
jgi:hypothetical protein